MPPVSAETLRVAATIALSIASTLEQRGWKFEAERLRAKAERYFAEARRVAV